MCCLINLPSTQSKYLCNRHARPERKEREEKERQKECLRKGVQFTWNRSSHTTSGWSVSVKMREKVLAVDNNNKHWKRHLRAVFKGKKSNLFRLEFSLYWLIYLNHRFLSDEVGLRGVKELIILLLVEFIFPCLLTTSPLKNDLITEKWRRLPGSVRGCLTPGLHTASWVCWVMLIQLKHFLNASSKERWFW